MAREDCRVCPELQKAVAWYQQQLAEKDKTIVELTNRIVTLADPIAAARMRILERGPVSNGESREPRPLSPAHVRRRPDKMSETDLSRIKAGLAAANGNPPEHSADGDADAARAELEKRFEQTG